MLGQRARGSRMALHRVHAVERHLAIAQLAPLGVGLGVIEVPRSFHHEICVERKNHIRFFKVQHRINRATKRRHGPRPRCVATRRFPLYPFRRRILGAKRLHLSRQRGACHRFGEDAHTCAAIGCRRHQRIGQVLRKLIEGADGPQPRHRGRAVGIVQVQHLCCQHGRGRALAGRMLRVAFDLRRAAHVALHQNRKRHATQQHRRGVIKRLARNEILGLLHVRQNLVGRGASTPRQSRQTEAGRHQHHEPPSAYRVDKLRQLTGKFALQIILKIGRLGKFFQAAPVAPSAHLRRAAAGDGR